MLLHEILRDVFYGQTNESNYIITNPTWVSERGCVLVITRNTSPYMTLRQVYLKDRTKFLLDGDERSTTYCPNAVDLIRPDWYIADQYLELTWRIQ